MKTLEILRFEIGYQARRWWTWLYAAVVLAVSFEIAVQAYVENAQAGGYWFNAPFVIASITIVGSVMGLLVAAAFAGDAGARDPETRMDPLIQTSPLGERSYLAGRFIAAFLLTALVLLAVQAALLAAIFVADVPPDLLGPIRIGTYLGTYALIALPNAFLATALLFSLAVLNRRAMASYLGAVVLFFVSMCAWVVVAERLGMWDLAKVVDPLGLTVLREVSQTTTAAQKNALSLWSNGSLLLNRATWLSVAAVILVVTHLRFRFEAAASRRGWRQARSSGGIGEVKDPSVPIKVPQVATSTGRVVRLRQLQAITVQSFQEVAISWGGLVLGLLTLILIVFGPRAMAHLGVPIVPTTERMVDWIGHPGEILWLIVPILTTFYAGELVWRDRETRMSEIADAAPVAEWVQLAGRYIGLALLLLSYHVMLIVGCILIQRQMGYAVVDLGLYLRIVLGLSLTEHLLFAALAFALHVLINQKYAGYLVVLGVYAFIASAPSVGLEHHLLAYGASPGWTYSDMPGFGPSIAPWLWFKGYWTAWAVLLGVVAVLLWVRGRETGTRARVALMRDRLTPRTVGVAATMAMLIVGTGGFIVYNTNVLNHQRSPEQRLDDRARYESVYGKFAGAAQPEIGAITLRAELRPVEREATLHTVYTLVNRTDSAIRTIHFLPDDEVETGAAAFDRPSRVVVDDSALHYRIHELGTPLAPNDSVHATFDVRFRRRGFGNDGIDPSVVGNGTYIEGNDWLPDIGYQRAREVAGASDRKARGLAKRREVRTLDDTAARYDRGARWIAFSAVVATDDGQVAVAPGELRRSWVEGGRRYFHYVADAPIRNDFAIYSARYAVRHARWDDTAARAGTRSVAIEVVHHPEHATNVDRMVRSAQASLGWLTRQFGPYPYRELRLVEQPGQSMSLHASPINISYQEAFAGLNPAAEPRQFDLVFAVVAHEIAHQWWGNQLSPADVEGGPLLSESLAWYSAMCIVADTHGEDHLQRLLDMMHESSWTISTRASVPLLEIYSRFAAYRKGPFAMYALREYVGEERVNGALRRLFERHKSAEPPLPTSRDLYAELQAVTPDSLRPLLADLFERNTYWELATKRVAAEPAGSGRWRVTLDVTARKIVVDPRGTETEVPMRDLVEIGVYGAGGSTTRGVALYRSMHRLGAGPQRISVVVAAKPVRAGMWDPLESTCRHASLSIL